MVCLYFVIVTSLALWTHKLVIVDKYLESKLIMKYLNIKLDEELSQLVDKAKKDFCLNPSEIARKLLRDELNHIIQNNKKL